MKVEDVPPSKSMQSLPPKSPFLAPRRVSSGVISNHSSSELELESPFSIISSAINSNTHIVVEPEHKSTLVGCTANLITAIVGAGIIGIPYAMKETGLVAGILLIVFSGAVGCKSLRLLVATAKHVDASSYETLCEAAFGQVGWVVCNLNRFLISWGPMLSYMMIVKDTAGNVLGYNTEAGQKMILVVCSVGIMLPLSLQRVCDTLVCNTTNAGSIANLTRFYYRTWLTWPKLLEYVSYSISF
jgi:hypothetical protein